MRGKERQEVDSMLEDGLASYSMAEPLLGMEERIVRSVLAQKKRRRARWPWLLAGVPVALLILVILSPNNCAGPCGSGRPSPEWVEKTTKADLSEAEIAVVRSEESPKHVVGAREASRSVVEPTVAQAHRRKVTRDEMFPSPQVLSAEESMIIAMVEQHPAEISQALIEAQKRSAEPVRVAAIHIEPLSH